MWRYLGGSIYSTTSLSSFSPWGQGGPFSGGIVVGNMRPITELYSRINWYQSKSNWPSSQPVRQLQKQVLETHWVMRFSNYHKSIQFTVHSLSVFTLDIYLCIVELILLTFGTSCIKVDVIVSNWKILKNDSGAEKCILPFDHWKV